MSILSIFHHTDNQCQNSTIRGWNEATITSRSHQTFQSMGITVFVPKSDGSTRLCVDYRRLNKVTKPDPFPMPRVDELVDRMGKINYMSTLDLTRWYYQIPVHLTPFQRQPLSHRWENGNLWSCPSPQRCSVGLSKIHEHGPHGDVEE